MSKLLQNYEELGVLTGFDQIPQGVSLWKNLWKV